MSRVDFVLVATVLACALGLVRSHHVAREQFAALEALKNEAHTLEETHGSLTIELSTWADPARVDQLAQTRLGLVAPTPERMATLETVPRNFATPTAPLLEPVPPTDTAPQTETAGRALPVPGRLAKLEALR